MPWINEAMCAGCALCVSECPVEAIAMIDNDASIDNDLCIRCGKCHDVCPQQAVRHDSERIPEEIAANLDRTRTLLTHCATAQERDVLIERMKRFFNKERKVAERTLSELQDLKGDPSGLLLRKATTLRQQMIAKMK